MIIEDTFTKKWIDDRSKYFKKGKSKGNSELIEKVINALYLLERLIAVDIDLIFKGGTALALLLKKIHRFSIDIDIILQNDDGLEVAFEKLIDDNFVFSKFEKIERKNTKEISKAHYKFFFTSILDDTEKYILLDILYEENPYIETISKPIESSFLLTEGEALYVTMPSIDCILGDKLTAFAPNTTGIPYGKDKELEIIKQLFDVSNLFDEISSVAIVRKTFNRIVDNELEYRNMKHLTSKDVLNDIYETSFAIALRGADMKEEFKQLELGVKRIKSHIFSRNFIIEDAVLSASKAAYIAMILIKDKDEVKKFDSSIDLRNQKIVIQGYSKYFKSIKKITPEGFYYWKNAVELNNIL